MLAIAWTAERTRLVAEALRRRPATSALGEQLPGEIQDAVPGDLCALHLDWPKESFTAACKTLEGEVGRLYVAIDRGRREGQPVDGVIAEQGEIYEAMGELKAWRRVSAG